MDPIRDGSNWYAYVNNDPVNWVDPWGLSAVDTKQKQNSPFQIGQDMSGKNFINSMNDTTTSTVASNVDIALTVAGVTIAKEVSNDLGNASTAIGIGAAIIDGVGTGIQTGSVTQGAFAVAANVTSAVAGAVVGGVVTGGLTALSGGAGAPLAATAGFVAGTMSGNAVSNLFDKVSKKLFSEK